MALAKPIIVSFSDGKDEEFPSAANTAMVLNLAPSTVRKRLKSGESLLWNGQQIRFRFK